MLKVYVANSKEDCENLGSTLFVFENEEFGDFNSFLWTCVINHKYCICDFTEVGNIGFCGE